MCGFCKVRIYVCVGFVMCGCVCGFCNVCVLVSRFCNVGCVCIYVGFEMCGCVHVWILKYMGVCECGFFNMWMHVCVS